MSLAKVLPPISRPGLAICLQHIEQALVLADSRVLGRVCRERAVGRPPNGDVIDRREEQ
jgi:hypothetical protein